MNQQDIINALTRATAEKSKTTTSTHLVGKLVAELSSRLDADQLSLLIWLNAETEKAMRAARRNNLNHFLFCSGQVESHWNDSGQPLLGFFYEYRVNTMHAFYEYHCNKNFDRAIQLFQQSAEAIRQLANQNMPFMLSVIAEQHLGIASILYRQGKIHSAFYEMGQSLGFIVSGKINSQYLNFTPGNSYRLWNGEDKFNTLCFVTEAVLLKYFEYRKEEKEKPGLLELLFKDVVEAIAINNTFPQTAMGIYCLYARFLLQGEVGAENDQLLTSLDQMPRILQFIFLDKLLAVHENRQGPDKHLRQEIKKYCSATLELDFLYSGKLPVAGDQLSPLDVTGEGAIVA